MQVAPSVERVTLELPFPPGHVHVYVLQSDDGPILVDAGAGFPDARPVLAGLDVERIVITHMHPDHVGGARDAVAATGARVLQGALDYEQCERSWASSWPDEVGTWFRRNGVPEDALTGPIGRLRQASEHVGFVRDPELLAPGDDVGGWEVVPLPGHSDGQIGLLRDGVLVCADHMLAYTAPSVGALPDRNPDPLGEYLASLEDLIALDLQIALPGHGGPVEDPSTRALELIAQHADRLERVTSTLGADGQTAYEVASVALRDDPQRKHPFAVAQIIATLERLVRQGIATLDDDGRLRRYALASSRGSTAE